MKQLINKINIFGVTSRLVLMYDLKLHSFLLSSVYCIIKNSTVMLTLDNNLETWLYSKKMIELTYIQISFLTNNNLICQIFLIRKVLLTYKFITLIPIDFRYTVENDRNLYRSNSIQ